MQINPGLLQNTILCLALVIPTGCTAEFPLAGLLRGAEKSELCTDIIRARIEQSLNPVSLPLELRLTAKKLVTHLPDEEILTLRIAARSLAANFGPNLKTADLNTIAPIAKTALYDGFDETNICSWPNSDRWIVADLFVDRLFLYLIRRGVNIDTIGNPEGSGFEELDGHDALIVALLLEITELPSNNSFNPKPLRGSG